MTVTDPDAAGGRALDLDLTVTTDDVVAMNTATLLRAAAFARLAGAVLLGVAFLGTAAWSWACVRDQQTTDEGFSSAFDEDDSGGLDFVERVDLFVNRMPYLVFASLPLAAGIALRAFADYSVARSGGSLTGYQPGDKLPAEANPGAAPPDTDPPVS